MSITLERPAVWHVADPWVPAGVAALGELLTARGMCADNPASNSSAGYTNPTFALEPGSFRCGDLEVRWGRHVGAATRQSRPTSRDEWAHLLRDCRDSLVLR